MSRNFLSNWMAGADAWKFPISLHGWSILWISSYQLTLLGHILKFCTQRGIHRDKRRKNWLQNNIWTVLWRKFLFGRVWWSCKGPRCVGWVRNFLSPLTTDSAGQLDVLGHDGHTLGMDGTQVGVLKETNQVSLRSLLQGHDGRALESQISLEVLGDFPHQTLEGELADEQLSALLVPPDLSESHSSRPVPVGLLHSSSGWGALTGSLGGQLLPGSLSSSGFTGSLLGSCHCECFAHYNSNDAVSKCSHLFIACLKACLSSQPIRVQYSVQMVFTSPFSCSKLKSCILLIFIKSVDSNFFKFTGNVYFSVF